MLFPSNELSSNLNKKTYTSEVNYFKDLNQATVKKIKVFSAQLPQKSNSQTASSSVTNSASENSGGSAGGGSGSSGEGSSENGGQSGGSTSGNSSSAMSQHMNALQNSGGQTQTGGSQNSDPGGSQNTTKPTEKLEDADATATTYSGKCGNTFMSDSEARAALKKVGINVNKGEPATSLAQVPSFGILFLEKLKKECNCDVMVTGGTEKYPHKTHGPKLVVFDLRENPQLNSYINGKGKNIDGAKFLYERAGTFAQTTATHWHVDANKYKCSI